MTHITIGGWNAIGLAMTLAGLLMLFKYGMPGRVSVGATQPGSNDPHFDEKMRHYTQMGTLGLCLTLLGGVIQIIVSLVLA